MVNNRLCNKCCNRCFARVLHLQKKMIVGLLHQALDIKDLHGNVEKILEDFFLIQGILSFFNKFVSGG